MRDGEGDRDGSPLLGFTPVPPDDLEQDLTLADFASDQDRSQPTEGLSRAESRLSVLSEVSASSTLYSQKPHEPRVAKRHSSRPSRRERSAVEKREKAEEAAKQLFELEERVADLEKVVITKTADVAQMMMEREKTEGQLRIINQQLKSTYVERSKALREHIAELKSIQQTEQERQRALSETKKTLVRLKYLQEKTKHTSNTASLAEQEHGAAVSKLISTSSCLDAKIKENDLLEAQLRKRIEFERQLKEGMRSELAVELKQEFLTLTRKEEDFMIMRNTLLDKENLIAERIEEYSKSFQILDKETMQRREGVAMEKQQREALLEQLTQILLDKRRQADVMTGRVTERNSELKEVSEDANDGKSTYTMRTHRTTASSRSRTRHKKQDDHNKDKEKELAIRNMRASDKHYGLAEMQQRSSAKFEKEYTELHREANTLEKKEKKLELKLAKFQKLVE